MYNGSESDLLNTPQLRVDLLARVLSTWQVGKGRADADESRFVMSELQTECDVERSPSPERAPQRRTVTLTELSTGAPSGTDADLIYGEWNLQMSNS